MSGNSSVLAVANEPTNGKKRKRTKERSNSRNNNNNNETTWATTHTQTQYVVAIATFVVESGSVSQSVSQFAAIICGHQATNAAVGLSSSSSSSTVILLWSVRERSMKSSLIN